MRTTTLAVAAVVLLALAACGDDGDTADGAGDGGDTTGATAPGADDGEDSGEAAGGATAVTVEGFAFDPDSLTVAAGDTVSFDNRDSAGHTATAGTPGAPDEGQFDLDLPAGGSAEVTLDEPGSYPYFCRIHTAMTGEIVVE